MNKLFFEDNKFPKNLGSFGDSTLKSDPTPNGYRCMPEQFTDCIMRKAVNEVGFPGEYKLFGNNCQTWADSVKEKYKQLEQDPQVVNECGVGQ